MSTATKTNRTSVFVARQPILDRDRRIVAYELLFRDSADVGLEVLPNPSLATARVAIDTLLSMGLSSVLGVHRGFINVDLEMLMSEAIEVLPPEQFVLEILETVPAHALERCRELRSRGFELALDDYIPGDERAAMLGAVDCVKVDLMLTERAALPKLVRELKSHGVCLLAEKVETKAEFETCMKLGFDLFQGYFFARPDTIKGSALDSDWMNLLSVIRAISDDRPSSELEDFFKRDARLGVQLLRIANSAALGSIQKITSFEHAMMYVGRQQLRRWLLLLLYANGEADATASPVLEIAAVRGRLLELLAPLIPGSGDSVGHAKESAFLVGMLSLADVILDRPIVEVLDGLDLEVEVRAGVLERQGLLGELLSLAEALEAGRFTELADLLQSLGLSVEHLSHAQQEAYAWYRDMGSSDVLDARS